ncbi:nucleoside monophosphate kinase [Pelagicoccus sp. SDUM812003]|uniref:nucleoside monophosphate kinase n=1 Tax=Pelagicoccus sp. SDUM812003 TaxID=3041267 RepID=UPI00280DE2E2|nr:nucleoside monophosphate kinase [Pelagicoccus sp. SDUM812003]MDQ8203626.1 nucleoside monophosphate kinase [Pelagicoccus sp. SDUM812003]
MSDTAEGDSQDSKTPTLDNPIRHQDLEVKDAQIIFNTVWSRLEEKFGRSRLHFPQELILLGGAPGAGKGTNTPFIKEVRGLTCEPIVVSSLLDTPEMRRIKDSGGMVGDTEVIGILLEKLLEPEYQDGAILDGFPRTFVQVECMKLLYHKMIQLRAEYYNSGYRSKFRQPLIHIMMLFIDEKESVARQLKRGREIHDHNEEVRRTGVGDLLEERATDLDPSAAKRRYKVFKERTYDALQSLKEIFHYHFINAQGDLAEVRQNIIKELQYQSSLELDPRTFESLHRLPIASKIVEHARQQLVRRLDQYEMEYTEQFHEVLDFIETNIMPIVKHHAITGVAHINTEDRRLDSSLSMAMLIDVFSERGYHASVDLHKIEVPEAFDTDTGYIRCRTKKVWRIQIRFKGSEIRRGS